MSAHALLNLLNELGKLQNAMFAKYFIGGFCYEFNKIQKYRSANVRFLFFSHGLGAKL